MTQRSLEANFDVVTGDTTRRERVLVPENVRLKTIDLQVAAGNGPAVCVIAFEGPVLAEGWARIGTGLNKAVSWQGDLPTGRPDPEVLLEVRQWTGATIAMRYHIIWEDE